MRDTSVRTAAGKAASAARKAATGTPYSSQADVDALKLAGKAAGLEDAVRLGTEGQLYFTVGSSLVDGPDVIAGE